MTPLPVVKSCRAVSETRAYVCVCDDDEKMRAYLGTISIFLWLCVQCTMMGLTVGDRGGLKLSLFIHESLKVSKSVQASLLHGLRQTDTPQPSAPHQQHIPTLAEVDETRKNMQQLREQLEIKVRGRVRGTTP